MVQNQGITTEFKECHFTVSADGARSLFHGRFIVSGRKEKDLPACTFPPNQAFSASVVLEKGR